MEYRDYNDNELIDYASEDNEEATNLIYEKYRPLIESMAHKMYLYAKNPGYDSSDLIQEGMLGLDKAIKTYQESKETLFYTYAKTCIERRMLSFIIGANRLKNKVLNDSLSLNSPIEDSNQSIIDFVTDNDLNPEEELIVKENEEELVKTIQKSLTDLESQVFALKINGLDYKEIAELLDKDAKSIDNALQRIKSKVKKALKTIS